MADETVVPLMVMQHNITVGKGLYWIMATKEKKEYVLRKLSSILNSGILEVAV